jgi:dienelactone hydrolase
VTAADPPANAPDDATRKNIEARKDKLAAAVTSLRRQGVGDPFLADVEVYLKAAAWITRYDEFFQKDAADWTLAALDRGLLRASQLRRGESPWLQITGHSVVRAYRSRIDGSIQPYAVTLPADYGKDPQKRWRFDVVLHGRNANLTEVSFLHQYAGDKPAPADQAYVKIDVYGRGNNAYRWAGEMDFHEAVDNFLAVEGQLRRNLLDANRAVLRGFSMGGAGTWHMGLHRPSNWCVLGPGAGFTATHGYIKGLPEKLPAEQEACLTIYDAVAYAENAFNVPVVAYAGADDDQLQAARNIEARLKASGLPPITTLVAPGLKHEFPPEWQKKAEEEYARHSAKGRAEYPRRVRFVTYTLKYPDCGWVEILGLDRHYEHSLVDAEVSADEGYKIKTTNIRQLHITLPRSATRGELVVTIDEQRLETRPYMTPLPNTQLHLYLEKRAGRWHAVLPEKIFTERLRRPQKIANLQGPIDDAFMSPFLCVRGTREGWHGRTQEYAKANLERFQQEWSKYFRGEVPVKDDVDVTPEDVAARHLILFGDPASNSLIEQVLPGLPLEWTKERVRWNGKEFTGADHVPVLIYPSPLATDRYVVLNSGHTFRAADFQGTNALLYPRLGDHAILKLASDKKDPLAAEVQEAGLFDDSWRLPPRR